MQPELQPFSVEARLSAVQVRFPKLDVPAEYRRACAKYGRTVDVGWLESFWLPRCRPVRRRSRAVIASTVAMDVFRAAKSEIEPAVWAKWWQATYPAIDCPAWADAPIDLKMRCVREHLVRGPKESINPSL